MSQKNVCLEKVIATGFCFKKTKEGVIGTEHPKEGYRKVMWVECPKEMKQEVIGQLVTRKAQKIARILNSIPHTDAIFLVKYLYDEGGIIRSNNLRMRSMYTGRSFERPRM